MKGVIDMNLTEATMLALQGKLNLNENKSVKAESRHLLPSQKKLIKQFNLFHLFKRYKISRYKSNQGGKILEL